MHLAAILKQERVGANVRKSDPRRKGLRDGISKNPALSLTRQGRGTRRIYFPDLSMACTLLW